MRRARHSAIALPLALMMLATGLLAACGSNASGLAANPWHLVAYTSELPVYAGVVPPDERERYTLTFATDGTLEGRADCNLFAGTYRATGASNLSITIGPSTLVACPDGSLGGIYVHALANAASWVITGGDLTITLDSGARLEFGVASGEAPTAAPSEAATTATAKPTASPTPKPTASPTPKPTTAPTTQPTAAPTTAPTTQPTAAPTVKPTAAPTAKPTAAPTPTPVPEAGLTGTTWLLTAMTLADPPFQSAVPPADQSKYTVTFATDGTFSAQADCNRLTGSYTTGSGGSMTITPGPSTIVACADGSLGDLYVLGLTSTARYAIASGQLTLTMTDGGTLQYAPQP
jgi:heat shock protein HslJ